MSKFDKILFRIDPVRVIARSAYFDGEWYKKRYDIRTDPARHYLNEGWKLDYDPSQLFSSKDYLINNPDLKDVNPLLHYEVFGQYEGRRPFLPAREFDRSAAQTRIQIPYEEYYEQLRTREVVSFDVFDTLVIRPFVRAEDLFVYLEKKYGAKGFAPARQEAEAKARQELNKEVDLEEIYAFIGESYVFLKDIEAETEISFCHDNPLIRPVYEQARKLGKRVIATSDMYLPQEIVRKILEGAGYQLDAIYVSCDYDMTKGQGDLYKEVLNREKLTKDQLIHFGDNYISDYSQAKTLGLEAYQTPKISDYILSQPQYSWLQTFSGYEDSLASSLYLAQIAEYLVDNDEPYFKKLGYMLGGPLAASYLSFVCGKAKESELDELLFAARDGYILKEVYEKYFPEKDDIPAAYACLSRACIYGAGRENKLNDDPEKLLKIAAKQLPAIEIHEDREENLAEYARHQTQIEDWSFRCDENLQKHLTKISEGHKRLGVVDMFSGNYTAQKGATHYLKDRIITGLYAGNFAESALVHASACPGLLGMRDNVPVKLSEFLISSPETSIIGLEANGQPLYEGEDPQRKERYEDIAAGIFAYVDDYRRFFSVNDGLFITVETWLALAECYLKQCSEEDVTKLAEIIDSENPVSERKDKNFGELITQYRTQGY